MRRALDVEAGVGKALPSWLLLLVLGYWMIWLACAGDVRLPGVQFKRAGRRRMTGDVHDLLSGHQRQKWLYAAKLGRRVLIRVGE